MVYWELGMNVFEKYLIDLDRCVNSYHWHWLSCAAFLQEQVFILQSQKQVLT